LNSGWYGIGSRFSASIPSAAVSPPTSTASSKVIGMNSGQLLSGRPPTLSGYHTPIAYHCMK